MTPVGLDRARIRQIWLMAGALPLLGAAGLVFGRAGYPKSFLLVGVAGSVVALLGSWLFLRRRYGALAAAAVAASEGLGRGPHALRDRLVLAFFRHDPSGLTLDDRNPAAYAAEVEQVITGLPALKSEAQVRQLIYGLLVSGFERAPDPYDNSLHALAAEVWLVWSEWSRTNPP
ncbi:MAG: hypothetical protein LC722_03225 [Actinobacteria bacterium]|nr:hypothetical protein [Actinomycetota bacterium]